MAIQSKNHLFDFLATAHKQVITIAPRLIIAVVIFILFWIGALIARYIIEHLSNRSKNRRYLMRLLGKITYVVILIFGLITALGTMGINILALITGLGLAGFALGFALKDMLSNTIAGFLILLQEPFKVNDKIVVDDAEGTVTDINLRHTELQAEGKHFLVPNSTVLTKTVTVNELE